MTQEPTYQTVTHRVRSKARFQLVEDPIVVGRLRQRGQILAPTPRLAHLAAARGASLVEIRVVSGNNVAEIYQAKGGEAFAFVFLSLDVWLSYTTS